MGEGEEEEEEKKNDINRILMRVLGEKGRHFVLMHYDNNNNNKNNINILILINTRVRECVSAR